MKKSKDDPAPGKKPPAKKAVTKKKPAAKKATAKKTAKKKTAKVPEAKKPASKKKVAKKKSVEKKPESTAKRKPAAKKAEAGSAARKPARGKDLKPAWRTIDDPRVKADFEEAEADMGDARDLAARSGGAVMSAWHAGQAAEKFLRTLAAAADVEVSVMWDIRRVFEALVELEGVSQMQDDMDVIAGPAGADAPPSFANQHHRAIAAAGRIRRTVLRLLGGVVDGEEEPIPEPVTAAEPRPHGDSERRTRRHRGRGGPPRAGRSDMDRRTSFVNTFLMCHNCGVRIPRTRQTARGRVPCPMCGRPMKVVR